MSFHRSRPRLLSANFFPLVRWRPGSPRRPVEKGKSREPPARAEVRCQRHIFTAIPLQLNELLGALRPSARCKTLLGLWFVITASLPTAWIKAGCLFFHLAISYFCDRGLFYRQGSLTSPTTFGAKGSRRSIDLFWPGIIYLDGISLGRMSLFSASIILQCARPLRCLSIISRLFGLCEIFLVWLSSPMCWAGLFFKLPEFALFLSH